MKIQSCHLYLDIKMFFLNDVSIISSDQTLQFSLILKNSKLYRTKLCNFLEQFLLVLEE